MLDAHPVDHRDSLVSAVDVPPSTAALDQIVEPVSSSTVVLVSGRRIEAEAGAAGDLLRVRNPGGDVVLTVLLTERGPVLRFEAADLQLAATRTMALTCESLKISAKNNIITEAGGALISSAGGDMTHLVGGRLREEAREMEVIANPGSVSIRANDDVDLNGERIRMNCEPAPMARSWEEFIARLTDATDG